MSQDTVPKPLLTAQIMAATVPLLAIIWVLKLPTHMGLLIFPEQIAAVMLALSLATIYLNTRGRSGLPRGVDIALALLSLGVGGWVFARFQVLSEQAIYYPTEALILGVCVVGLVLDTVRRVLGWVLVGIFALFVAYALWSDVLPGALAGRPMPLTELLQYLATDSAATWGSSLQVASFVVVVFVLFGGFLIAVGGGEFFTQLSMRVSGSGPGGAAKIGVTASALFGSISGSAVSNVMSTGVMTIPMMIRSGLSRVQAGAIEAVASTGGQLMPPIMGAAAFLMAELLQVDYREILVAALLPALIYYASIFLQIDFLARRDKVGSLAGERREAMKTILRAGWSTMLGFVVLLGSIFVLNREAEVAATWTVFALVIAALIAQTLRPGMSGSLTLRGCWSALSKTGQAVAEVLLVTAAAGMIVGILSITGLGFTLSILLLDLGGSTLFGMLAVTALVAIVLGLGLPTTAVYLLLASLAAPALVQVGIPPIAAHMFVFYYGMLSMITPPIALASFAAAAISGAGQIRTGVESFRVGWVAYLLPFLFIYKPALLMDGTAGEILYVAVSSLVALVLVAGGVIGHALRPLQGVMRLLWAGTGLATIAPLNALAGHAVEWGVSAFGLLLLAQHLTPVLRARRAAT
ncbi:TRAP transporter permease [Alloyangia pacifica]|uniref:TRAP transporter, 4TM/12TM fusion protein n=1 Tax=Alloyangia pacifica TaxID=311180 RepID=A0A1I6QWE7_9RHOB|nr:TRAP transporter fused permease subunit [Alloyangia pacifica]SDG02093.1 TRAP transporter, 4TM/12TM fusion protein [Alloyangia pacifica]SFS56742.1 TRAP transporter, 4TM/12TM fusion protein [Alloyangia pacifica]